VQAAQKDDAKDGKGMTMQGLLVKFEALFKENVAKMDERWAKMDEPFG